MVGGVLKVVETISRSPPSSSTIAQLRGEVKGPVGERLIEGFPLT